MRLPGFAGGSNVLSSTLEDCELSINLLPETGTPGTPKAEKWLPRRPGLRWLFTVGTDPVDDLFEINGRLFGVSGTIFFEQFDTDTYTVRGTVAYDAIDKATMCSNGTAGDQVFIIAGSTGYIFDLGTNTLTEIIDPDFPDNPVMCEFFAGYFFVLARNSRSIQWSNLEDGLTWDTLDVYERSWAADNINFIKRLGTHIWVVGNRTSEVLYATGGVDVFAPAQESLIEHGSVARFTGLRMPVGIVCLDQDERGVGQVVLFKGLQPDSISTYAINLEQQIQTEQPLQSGILNASWACSIQMNGHVWYLLNNQSGTFKLTPIFDFSEGLWHHWAHWDSTLCEWFPFVARCHSSAFEKHYIGDRRTGAVYELSMSNLMDQLVPA